MGTYLNRTPSSAGNEKTWTVSLWVKRASITSSASQFLFASDTNYSDYVWCRFCGTEVTGKADMLQVFMTEPNAREGNVRTNRLFRDPASWYHIVVRCDLTQSTAADRLRIYVNGVQETSFDTATYLNQNDDNINWNSNVPQVIGAQLSSGTSERFQNGYITNFVNIDGQSLAPTSFGETDSTTGEWKPKADLSGLTFGTNGFWQKYESAGNLGLDSSGNSNTYTVNNAGTGAQTVDTASNNFATFNPLSNNEVPNGNTFNYLKGNLNFKGSSGSDTSQMFTVGSIGVSSGKWYWEAKMVAEGSIYPGMGIVDSQFNSNVQNGYAHNSSVSAYGYTYTANGTKFNNDSETSYGNTYTTGDIIGIAVDLDNSKIYWSKNGTFQNGGDPTSGSTGTGSAFNLQTGLSYLPTVNLRYSPSAGEWSMNFGNPAFSISSGNADGAGHGNFEYAVPSGYYALCTKNINQYG